jgi:hypothetical protein
MKLKEAIQQANRTEDAREIARIMNHLRFNGFNYKDSADFFQRCDPSIDLGRFEELAQLADYAESR